LRFQDSNELFLEAEDSTPQIVYGTQVIERVKGGILGVFDDADMHVDAVLEKKTECSVDYIPFSVVLKSPGVQAGVGASWAFLPYFLLNRSTRPAESRSFCLPV
jgi:hypothetical protein